MNRNDATRRVFLKQMAIAALGLAALPSAGFAYVRYAEPRWLEKKEVALKLERLPKEMNGMRVVQFSDVHLGFHYSSEHLSGLGAAINRLQPDMICFTGDLIDYALPSDNETAAIIEALASMEAPLGKFAVLGNHDYYKNSAAVAKILSAGGFTVLVNAAAPVKRNGSTLWVAGLDDQWKGKPDIAKALKQMTPDDFVLLLSHCPDIADTSVRHAVDLQLSGHSHGGQVRIPFYENKFVPKYAKKYVMGLYTLGDGKLQLYVNRGIGVSEYPVRFRCRPELTVFTLQNS
ncbi:metallophosphoesterase [Paenibacillus mesophilus]|nr:metallophosphoesterase [Paenibacillus mesophilus]